MPGPLPDPNAQRRNKPTIPTTALPAKGRPGPVPKAPNGYEFGPRASAWWQWAWKTPQAASWSAGDLYVVARRALLEDDIAVLEAIDSSVDLDELLEGSPLQAHSTLKAIIATLKSLAGGSLAVKKEAREIDDRLGLTPKGRLALRLQIVDDEDEEKGRVRKLRPVPTPASEDPRKLLSG